REQAAEIEPCETIAAVHRQDADTRGDPNGLTAGHAGVAAPAQRQSAETGVFQAADEGGIAEGRLKSAGPPIANPLSFPEAGRVERRDQVAAIAQTTAEVAREAEAELVPGCGNDQRFDEGPFDAVE